eukprot:Selendium_serpulae@DN3705_c0_g1_i10.p1
MAAAPHGCNSLTSYRVETKAASNCCRLPRWLLRGRDANRTTCLSGALRVIISAGRDEMDFALGEGLNLVPFVSAGALSTMMRRAHSVPRWIEPAGGDVVPVADDEPLEVEEDHSAVSSLSITSESEILSVSSADEFKNLLESSADAFVSWITTASIRPSRRRTGP